MDKMAFGYDRLRELKPDIILGSVSAFGQYGPYRERPGFDPLGQAMSGLMSLTGMPVGTPLGTASSSTATPHCTRRSACLRPCITAIAPARGRRSMSA
jgi:crotonobetainyl-CoA:carnitine CoA-transferase CaiB-like acyl-CoA transferase